jgi:hypothetical protein
MKKRGDGCRTNNFARTANGSGVGKRKQTQPQHKLKGGVYLREGAPGAGAPRAGAPGAGGAETAALGEGLYMEGEPFLAICRWEATAGKWLQGRAAAEVREERKNTA